MNAPKLFLALAAATAIASPAAWSFPGFGNFGYGNNYNNGYGNGYGNNYGGLANNFSRFIPGNGGYNNYNNGYGNNGMFSNGMGMFNGNNGMGMCHRRHHHRRFWQ
jgi:hypothetical protein